MHHVFRRDKVIDDLDTAVKILNLYRQTNCECDDVSSMMSITWLLSKWAVLGRLDDNIQGIYRNYLKTAVVRTTALIVIISNLVLALV